MSRRGNWNVGLSHSKYSSRHMAQMISMASAHSARLSHGRHGTRSVPSVSTGRCPTRHVLREDVGSRHPLGHARRVGEAIRQQRHTEAETNVLGGLGERADHDLWRRAVRSPLTKMVLHEPRDVEAHLVGELHLIEHLGGTPAARAPAGPTDAAPRPTVAVHRSRTAGPTSLISLCSLSATIDMISVLS